MGVLDNFRGMSARGRRLGIEIGRRVAAVELNGTPPVVSAAGQSPHAGYSGEELGGWLRRWMEAIDVTAKSARAVVTDGDIQHYLVNMPEMSDKERHLAAGAEIRKLSPVPASQLAYSHMAVGWVEEGGVSKQKVLISAIDKSTLRNTTAALEAAGLQADLITTVPTALVKAAEMLPPTRGGMAIAWLAPGRSYLVVMQDGAVELVRDFVLRSDEQEIDPEKLAETVGSELRRSFLYFGQRAKGATINRLVLAGPLQGLADLAHLLRSSLGTSVELFDVSARVDMVSRIDPDDQPALAAALGAASMTAGGAANLVPPEQVTESRVRNFMSAGRIAAGIALVAVVGWGLLSLLNASVLQSRLSEAEGRLTEARTELDQARVNVQARAAHGARMALLESRALESTLLGTALQSISQRIPDLVGLQSIQWTRQSGDGVPYWDAQLNGLVFGTSRSESQAIFNRFWTLLLNDPVVHDLHLVEPLVIGTEAARTLPPLVGAVRDSMAAGPQIVRPGERQPVRGASGLQPGESMVRTTVHDLPPFAPTETSVSFKLAVQLKAIDSGGSR